MSDTKQSMSTIQALGVTIELFREMAKENESLKRELEAAKQDAMVYRREWELACERYNYACEERDAVKADRDNLINECRRWEAKRDLALKGFSELKAERDELKELVREAEYYMANEGEGLWLERKRKALGE